MNNSLKYTCLFGGGAIRGLAYVGAIRAMEELNIEFDIIGGSSVGSIFAILLACGYKSYELENLFMKVNFDLFRDIHLGFGSGIALSRGGIFVDWLNELIANKIPLKKGKNATFEDLEKELVVITTNLNKFNTQEFSKSVTPNFEISKAIRISSSMPGLMPPFNFNNASLVDGDLQKASPMWKLTDTLDKSKSRILEFRLEGDCSIQSKSPLSFINTIYSCVTNVATNFVTEIYGNNDRFDCIKINTGNIFFADLNLDKQSRRNLINIGYEETMKYFNEVLPIKKENLLKIYSQALTYLKNAEKGLNENNVEEVEWWFGDLFILLCENKEVYDETIYKKIVNLKNLFKSSTKRFLLIYRNFKNKKILKKELKDLINIHKDRIVDLQLFLQNSK